MSQSYDVAIVGGGIHGTGIAQAAAAAGYSTLLLEKTDLAAGTSSRSSKLIHGGLRYLETWQFGLVAECLRERSLLLRLAPDLVQLRDFYIPIFAQTRRPPWLVRIGLGLYAVLGRFGPGTRFSSVGRNQWGSLDGLRTDDLKAVLKYSDAQTDDRLLTRAVMASAQSLGAELAMPAQLFSAIVGNRGVTLRYRVDNTETEAHAAVLINAAGPWANEVLQMIEPAQSLFPVVLVQGSHIVVSHRFERGMYYLESPRDGRAVFVMPRNEDTLVGTTEIPFRGHPDDVVTYPRERSYLAAVVEHYFPALRGSLAAKITGATAGLRVLPAGKGHAFHRPRETILRTDDKKHPRVLSIYGGKLTAYRATAEKVIEHLRPVLPQRQRRALTRELSLVPPADHVD